MSYNRKFTPDFIRTLGPGQVFVFGSNLAGHHAGGAARTALRMFGAEMGNGEGPQGRSYAIPTMHGGPDAIAPYVARFIAYAKAHPEQEFLVTPVGCGIAGFSAKQIAPLFADALPVTNILLPSSFVEILES